MRLLPAWLAVGCLIPDLSDTLDPGPAQDDAALVEGGILVDATSEVDWVAYDLDAADFVEHTGDSWDLAFRRFQVDLADDLGAAAVEGVAFDEVTEVPSDGWRFDEPDADGDGIPEYALGDWYDYDQSTHTLSPADRVYVVESSDLRLYKLAFYDYYDAAGTPARITFRAAALE